MPHKHNRFGESATSKVLVFLLKYPWKFLISFLFCLLCVTSCRLSWTAQSCEEISIIIKKMLGRYHIDIVVNMDLLYKLNNYYIC